MKNNIAEQISSLRSATKSGANITSIGEKWLSICEEIFDGNATSCFDRNGKHIFIPSSLRQSVSTNSLSKLLEIWDMIDKYSDSVVLPNKNDYLNSILYHLRQRAKEDDVQAKVVLYFHEHRKMAEVDSQIV